MRIDAAQNKGSAKPELAVKRTKTNLNVVDSVLRNQEMANSLGIGLAH